MPTYEYECESCGRCFEKYQSITARPLRKCPVCGKKLRRKIGAGGGIIFKGSGFYETDYKRKRVPPVSDAAREDSSAEKNSSTSESSEKIRNKEKE